MRRDGAAAETGATRGRTGGGGAAVAGGGDAVDNTDDEEGEEDEEEDSDVESAVGFGAAPKDKPKSAEAAESDDDDDDDDVFVAEEPSAGEQLGALKPWHAAIKPPTNAPPPEEVDCSPPSEELELSWVYGFRGYDTRRVAAWVGRRAGGDGGVGGGGGAGGGAKIVYPAAAVVVMYDTVTHEQRFFREHKDDVLGWPCMRREASLPAAKRASARAGARASPPSGCGPPSTPSRCRGRWCSQRATSAGSRFSRSTRRATFCAPSVQTTTIRSCFGIGSAAWRCAMCRRKRSESTRVASSRRTRRTAGGRLRVGWCSPERAWPAGARRLFSQSQGRRSAGERPNWRCPGGSERRLSSPWASTLPTSPSSEAASGGLVVFELASCKLLGSTKDAHRGPVHVLCEADGLRCTSTAGTVGALSAGGGLLSCGKDGQVRLWAWDVEGKQLVPLGAPALSLEAALPLLNGGRGGHRLRSMDWSAEHGLLLGTHASELLLVRESADECRVLTHGHAQRPVGGGEAAAAKAKAQAVKNAEAADDSELGALRSVATPLGSAPICASGGDDAMVRLWHLGDRRLLAARALPAAVSALSFDETPSDDAAGEVGSPSGLRVEGGRWCTLRRPASAPSTPPQPPPPLPPPPPPPRLS